MRGVSSLRQARIDAKIRTSLRCVAVEVLRADERPDIDEGRPVLSAEVLEPRLRREGREELARVHARNDQLGARGGRQLEPEIVVREDRRVEGRDLEGPGGSRRRARGLLRSRRRQPRLRDPARGLRVLESVHRSEPGVGLARGREAGEHRLDQLVIRAELPKERFVAHERHDELRTREAREMARVVPALDPALAGVGSARSAGQALHGGGVLRVVVALDVIGLSQEDENLAPVGLPPGFGRVPEPPVRLDDAAPVHPAVLVLERPGRGIPPCPEGGDEPRQVGDRLQVLELFVLARGHEVAGRPARPDLDDLLGSLRLGRRGAGWSEDERGEREQPCSGRRGPPRGFHRSLQTGWSSRAFPQRLPAPRAGLAPPGATAS